MFDLLSILVIVLGIDTVLATIWILRLSRNPRVPASEIRESQLDESSVKE